ncbi:MAG: hypothetical protein FWC36_00560 [Spirochaetes bacterium]|nr:hypothetical protein [Spirochaetota bacterium]
MIRKTLLVFIFIFALLPAFGLEIYIAPISFIDSRTDRVSSSIEIPRDIARESERYLTGKKVFFRYIRNREINAPVSVIDAITLSRLERAEYLLYGFVERREYTYRAELRLLDFERREIIRIFYSADDINNYERLIRDLSYKIVTYLDNVFALGVLDDEPGRFSLSVPVSLGYWSYISSGWINTATGTFAFSAGLDLITNDRAFSDFKNKTYLAWGFNVEYRYGIGKHDAELQGLHIIILSLPVRVHIESLSKEDGLFFGFGLLYEFNIANVEEMYANKKRYLFSHMGMLGSVGYQWRLNDKIRVSFDNLVTVSFLNPPMISFSPRISFLYCVYSREAVNKWK